MTASEPLPVSVIIPAYGQAEYVVACVESAIGAGLREVIVVDDGSPDDTAERLAPLVNANRIRYIAQANAGMAAARNVGAALATSEYLYFLDADDLVFPKALFTLVQELERNPATEMACGEMVIFSGEPPDAPAMQPGTRHVHRATFLRFNPVGSPGQVLVRRSAFEAVGGFHQGYPGTEDWDLWLRIVERCPALWVQHPVMAYRLHGANTSRNVARMYQSSLRVARRHLARLPPAERPIMRAFTYRALRAYHVPRLEKMLVETVGSGELQLGAAAAQAWVTAWSADVTASVRLKAFLAAQGRWRLTAGEQPV